MKLSPTFRTLGRLVCQVTAPTTASRQCTTFLVITSKNSVQFCINFKRVSCLETNGHMDYSYQREKNNPFLGPLLSSEFGFFFVQHRGCLAFKLSYLLRVCCFLLFCIISIQCAAGGLWKYSILWRCHINRNHYIFLLNLDTPYHWFSSITLWKLQVWVQLPCM